MYSAIKQGGVRLYQLARAGEEVERAPRRVRIDRLELLAFEPPRFRVAIACSKGTYVRSLVADIGNDVGCGAHLRELRRTRSGRFTLAQASSIADVATATPVALIDATGLPRVRLVDARIAHALSGVQFSVDLIGAENLQQFQMIDDRDRLIAIAHAEAGRVVYDRVFPELAGA